jgi:plasmid stabilization system protein ParE
VPTRYRADVTRAAERDLVEIHEFIARDEIASLERFPFRGRVIPEARHLGVEYRELLHGAYRIIYRIDGERVWVVRVVHGARLLDLPPGGEAR